MDMQSRKWFAQIQLSGVAEPINSDQNSLAALLAFIGRTLMSHNPRLTRAGSKEIVIRFADQPFPAHKQSLAESQLVRANELLGQLDDSQLESGPSTGQSAEQYRAQLLESGYDPATASVLVDAWFKGESVIDPQLEAWQNDSRAIRFRLLTASAAEFSKALPSEYEALKQYCLTHYPQFVAQMTLRTA